MRRWFVRSINKGGQSLNRYEATTKPSVILVPEAHRETENGQVLTEKDEMNDQLSLLPMLDDAEHPTWLLNGKPAIQNDSGVYVENVFKFREGKLSGVYVEVNLCAEGDFVLFEFDYFTGTYGCGHPLCRPCHECHRNNSAEFLAEAIFDTFKNSVVPYDGNLKNYPKETKELLKLFKRACDRIAKEIV